MQLNEWDGVNFINLTVNSCLPEGATKLSMHYSSFAYYLIYSFLPQNNVLIIKILS